MAVMWFSTIQNLPRQKQKENYSMLWESNGECSVKWDRYRNLGNRLTLKSVLTCIINSVFKYNQDTSNDTLTQLRRQRHTRPVPAPWLYRICGVVLTLDFGSCRLIRQPDVVLLQADCVTGQWAICDYKNDSATTATTDWLQRTIENM